MTGKVLSGSPHRCFLFYPQEAGMFAAVGTRWQCNGCSSIWELKMVGEIARWRRDGSE